MSMADEINYRNVLVAHSHLGHINIIREHARILGYRYFLWNDIVYTTKECYDTGYTIDFLEKPTTM